MRSSDSTLLYLFGLPAAGKNYVGTILAETFGYTFYDGDLNLPEEMREAVREGRPFTEEMRDRYYEMIVDQIRELRTDHQQLAFGQATFKERHRQQIAEAFPDVVFVLVESTEELRHARLARGNNPVTVEYARRIASFFEPPQHPHYTICNNFDRAFVVSQLERMLANLAETRITQEAAQH